MPFGHGDGGGGPTREMLERARRMADLDGSPACVAVGSPAEFFEHVERGAFDAAPRCRCGAASCTSRPTAARSPASSARRSATGAASGCCVEVELWSATVGTRPRTSTTCGARCSRSSSTTSSPASSIAWVHADAEAVLRPRRRRRSKHGSPMLLDELAPAGPRRSPTRPTCRSTASWCSRSTDDVDGRPTSGRRQRGGRRHGARRSASRRLRDRAASTDRVVVTDSSMTNSRLAVRWDHDGNITLDHRPSVRPASCCPTGALGGGARAGARPSGRVRRVGPRVVDVRRLASDVLDADSVEVVDRRTARRAGRACSGRSGRRRAPIDLRAARRQRRRSTSSTSSSTGSTTSTCCRWRSRSTCAPTPRRATSSSASSRRPTHPSNSWDAAKFEVCAHRYVDLASPTSGSPCSTTAATATACSTARPGQPGAGRPLPRSRRRPRPARVTLARPAARRRAGRRASTRPHRLNAAAARSSVGASGADGAGPGHDVAGRRVLGRVRRPASRSTPSSSPTTASGDLDRAPPRGDRQPDARRRCGRDRPAIAAASSATCSRSRTQGDRGRRRHRRDHACGRSRS